jgi:hypothetical protein
MYVIAQSGVERARINAVTSRVIINALHSRAFLKRLIHFDGATEPA